VLSILLIYLTYSPYICVSVSYLLVLKVASYLGTPSPYHFLSDSLLLACIVYLVVWKVETSVFVAFLQISDPKLADQHGE